MKTVTRKAIALGATIASGLTVFFWEVAAVIHAVCHLLGIAHPF